MVEMTRNFSRHQEIIDENIREYTNREIYLALQMELKATVIHEESKEYYEIWKNEDKKQEKSLGSPCPMIWDDSSARVITITHRYLVMAF